MAHYCRNCGRELDGQRKFCVHCGVKLEASATTDQCSATDRIGSPAVENVCQSCGNPLRENLKFCTACGQPVAVATTGTAAEPKKSSETGNGVGWPGGAVGVGRMLSAATMAADWPGETVLQSGLDIFGSAQALAAQPGLAKTVKQGLTGLGGGFKEVFGHPQKLLPALVLGLLWLLQVLLPALGIKLPFSGFFSWLTFARGGLSGGVGALIGGTIGKALFAGMVTALILPLFAGKNPFVTGIAGLKQWRTALLPKDLAGVSLLLLGAGLGLLANCFLTGGNSLQNSMLGIVMTLSLLRTIGTRPGAIITGFLSSLAAGLVKQTLGNRLDEGLSTAANRLLGGLATGTALGVLLSPLPVAWFDYALGGLLALIGLVLIFIASQKRGGTPS